MGSAMRQYGRQQRDYKKYCLGHLYSGAHWFLTGLASLSNHLLLQSVLGDLDLSFAVHHRSRSVVRHDFSNFPAQERECAKCLRECPLVLRVGVKDSSSWAVCVEKSSVASQAVFILDYFERAKTNDTEPWTVPLALGQP